VWYSTVRYDTQAMVGEMRIRDRDMSSECCTVLISIHQILVFCQSHEDKLDVKKKRGKRVSQLLQ